LVGFRESEKGFYKRHVYARHPWNYYLRGGLGNQSPSRETYKKDWGRRGGKKESFPFRATIRNYQEREHQSSDRRKTYRGNDQTEPTRKKSATKRGRVDRRKGHPGKEGNRSKKHKKDGREPNKWSHPKKRRGGGKIRRGIVKKEQSQTDSHWGPQKSY